MPFLVPSSTAQACSRTEAEVVVMCAGPALLLALGQLAEMQSCMPLQLLTLEPAMGMQLGHQAVLLCQLPTSSIQSNMPPWQLTQVRSGLTTL